MARWLLCAVLCAALPGAARASWLRGKQRKSEELTRGISSEVFRGPCTSASSSATCWCGEGPDRRQTIISVKQCPYTTPWGSQCEPCVPAEELCQLLEHCASCHQQNPDVICADCPPDKYGLYCEKERPCKMPNVTVHTTVHPYSTRKGVYKLEFRCTGGRVRDGPRAIRCLNGSGTWNKKPPQCVQPMRCASPPTSPIPFTHIKENNHHSVEHVVYECDVGYIPSGGVMETALQCQNGIWVMVGDLVQCEPSPKCTSLPTYMEAQLKTGTPVKSVYHAGEMVQFECKDSFQPVANHGGNFSLVCSGKQWSGQDPECELKGCIRLTVNHGDVSYIADSNSSLSEDFLPLHTVAQATCDQAYTLENPQNVTCSRTGHWLPAAPKCVPKVCEDLERGKMCSVIPTSHHVVPETNRTEIYPGQTVKFLCKAGYFRKLHVGQTERICLYNGTLSGSEIQCDHVQTCRIVLPPDDQHVRYCRGKNCQELGKDMFQNRQYELPSNVVLPFGWVEFSCDDNDHYCLVGVDKQQCMLPNGPGRSSLAEIRAPKCTPVCGIRKFPKEPLIMGGQSTVIEAWPWQAALLEVRWSQAEFLCGATLISDRWAITAAHCVTVENTTRVVVDAKHLRLSYGTSSSLESKNQAANNMEGKYNVKNITIHPGYSPHSLDSDIALLQLQTPAVIDHHVGVACLPSGGRHLIGGEQGVVTGWGRTEMESLSKGLRELDLLVVNASQCRKHYEDQGYNGVVVTDGMFCAMSNSTLEDATDGDSGGPFVKQDDDGRWVLEGIVSWGAPEKKKPSSAVNRRAHVKLSKGPQLLHTCEGLACFGGYTRVSKYVEWIQNKTGGEVGSPKCNP